MNEGENCKRRNDGSQFHFLGAQFKKTWGFIWGTAEHSQLQLCQCKVKVKMEAIIYITIYKLLHKVGSPGKESGPKHLKLNNQEINDIFKVVFLVSHLWSWCPDYIFFPLNKDFEKIICLSHIYWIFWGKKKKTNNPSQLCNIHVFWAQLE